MQRNLIALSIATAAALASLFALRAQFPSPTHTAVAPTPTASVENARLFAMRLQEPTLSSGEARRLAVEGDTLRRRVVGAPALHTAEAVAPDDLGVELRRRLAAAEVSDADARAYYRANLELFGERSFEASRSSIQQLLAIEQVRRDLALP